MTLVRVENVSKIYWEGSLPITALSSVSLQIEEGSFVALCGPSGSGKTTLLNLIGCLDKATEGKIYLEEETITVLPQGKLSELRLRKIGFIFQDYNLIPTFTVAENIEYVLWLQGVSSAERRKKSSRICERFGIGSLIHRRPSQLSRGQQQRVAVARAIIHQPRLVLGDEITANLDQKTGMDLMEFLKERNQQEGISFLYATHDPVMLKYAGRVIRMQDGQVIDQTQLSERRNSG